mgnify:CR=1 FL=1
MYCRDKPRDDRGEECRQDNKPQRRGGEGRGEGEAIEGLVEDLIPLEGAEEVNTVLEVVHSKEGGDDTDTPSSKTHNEATNPKRKNQKKN